MLTMRCFLYIPQVILEVQHIRKPVLHRVGKKVKKSGLLVCRLGGTHLGQVAEVKPVGLLVPGASVHVVPHQQHNLLEQINTMSEEQSCA